MCGIAGWIVDGRHVPRDGTLISMLAALAHRGPDDEGTYQFESRQTGRHTALGHRRLAIIDPAAGAQPLCDPAGEIALTFNGEIYNFRHLRTTLIEHGYRFSSDSDTEVLLAAYRHWDVDLVDHLRGMFAFAIWDARKERLLLARDRFGEKPLYVCEDAGGLFFASEIKALLQIPAIERSVDLQAVWEYLAYRYVPAPATLFEGIRKLMPGTIAVWERGELTQTRYWSPPDRYGQTGYVPLEAAAEGFLAKLDEAVNLQMVSDVPFGAFLSGGIDSSTIVALMSRHTSRVKTFSVGFRESRYSELDFARQVAKRFATEHGEIVISEREVMDQLPELVRQRDAPVSEPSDVAIHLLAREAARSVKMVLTGEGSDELLGGYPKHVAESFAGGFQRLPAALRNGLLMPLTHALPYGCRRIKTAVINLNTADWRERYVRWFGALSRAERERFTALRAPDSPPADAPPFDADPGASPLRRMLYFDQTSWLPDNLLERTDRMTMAASLEARVPFLDHELAAFVSTLPDRYRVHGRHTKRVLHLAARGLLPRQILERSKVGFRVPVNEWFRGAMRDYLREHLQSASSITRPYYAEQSLDRVLSEHFSGRQNHEKLIWTLLNLEVWHRRYA